MDTTADLRAAYHEGFKEGRKKLLDDDDIYYLEDDLADRHYKIDEMDVSLLILNRQYAKKFSEIIDRIRYRKQV